MARLQVFSPTMLPLTLTCLLTLTLVPAGECTCSTISNNDCTCLTPNHPAPSVTCSFQVAPQAPLFTPSMSRSTLGTLDLSGQNLTDLPEDFFGVNTTVIDVVNLSNNSFQNMPVALSKLAGLRVLNVSHNQLTSLSLTVLTAIPRLESLYVDHNSLSTLAFKEGKVVEGGPIFSRLKDLSVSQNVISSVDSGVFQSTPHLTSLDLSHNRLTTISHSNLAYLDLSLVSLDLSHNLLKELTSTAVQALQHLRILSLAHNPLTDMSTLQFPTHLRSLDLSHCALSIVDHCQLSSMADLIFIGLDGNDLQCTCQLYLLLQWYQNLHHMAGDFDSSNNGQNWTCRNTTNTTMADTTTHHLPTVTEPTDEPWEGVVSVSNLTQCQDSETHCQTLEHAEHHVKGSSQIVVTLHVASSDNTLMASWTYEENGEVVVEGFRLRYMPEDEGPTTSPTLPADQRSYVMQTSGLEQHYMVCLDVLASETSVVHQECKSMKDESSNVVVGILAGVVFLVPCIIAISYVIFKDRRIKREMAKYKAINGTAPDIEDVDEDEHATGCLFHSKSHQHVHHLNEQHKGHKHAHDVAEPNGKSQPKETKLHVHNIAGVNGLKTPAESKLTDDAMTSSCSSHSEDETNTEEEKSAETVSTPHTTKAPATYNTATTDSARHVQSESASENGAPAVNGGHNSVPAAREEQTDGSANQGADNSGFECSKGDNCHDANHHSTNF